MSKRVIIGTRGSEQGMWITPSGKDAETATAQEDYLVNTSRNNTQPILKGIAVNPTVYYTGSTRYTTFDPIVVCDEYGGYWQGCWDTRPTYDENGKLTGFEAYWKEQCTWIVYCKKSHVETTQTDHPGVATYETTIPHNLGYIPQSILSTSTDYPGNTCPNIFIDENNIYLRYYEADVGTVGSGIVFTAPKPSSYTLYCTVHYTLFSQAA